MLLRRQSYSRAISTRPAAISAYLEVLKPRETLLLTFIGGCAAFIAAQGSPPLPRLLLALLTIAVASAGANGMTNYLDRDIDARMARTRHRALPAGRIRPAAKVLPLLISLVIAGLALAWWLHPLAFVFDVAGTAAAVVWRKRATCVFPQGVVAGCAPVLIGWFAVAPGFSWTLVWLCALIAAWLPIHVWSVMIAHRQDYLDAGLRYFPMSREVRQAVKVLVIFSLALGFAAVVLYFVGGFALLYLAAAVILSAAVAYASFRLVLTGSSAGAWKLYKLSTFPYLGLLFLAMVLDVWLF